ncbi:hypothetical protein BDY24DRAFT_385878 [Mrakia frigida]|uniref:uncharacterized protein n=1 Tax=Mrakia frigida TaxID=29902 RepID=UPI003FCC0523
MLFLKLILPILVGLIGFVEAQNTIVVNTPAAVVFCQPTLLSWSGGTPPYFVNINAGGSVSVVLLNLLVETTATSYTWTTDLAPGTSFTLAVKDSDGYENFAAEAVVGENPSGVTTCPSASGNATASGTVSLSTTASPTSARASASSAASASVSVSEVSAAAESASSSVAAAAATTDSTGAATKTIISGGSALLTALMAMAVGVAL